MRSDRAPIDGQHLFRLPAARGAGDPNLVFVRNRVETVKLTHRVEDRFISGYRQAVYLLSRTATVVDDVEDLAVVAGDIDGHFRILKILAQMRFESLLRGTQCQTDHLNAAVTPEIHGSVRANQMLTANLLQTAALGNGDFSTRILEADSRKLLLDGSFCLRQRQARDGHGTVRQSQVDGPVRIDWKNSRNRFAFDCLGNSHEQRIERLDSIWRQRH